MANEFNLSGANLELWLKADAGVQEAAEDAAEDGDDVQFWRDQSGNGVDVSQDDTNRRPNLTSNSINFNPTVSFNGGNNGDVLTGILSSFSGDQPYSIFAVFNPSNKSGENLFAIGKPSFLENIAYHPNYINNRYLYHFSNDLIVPGTISGWQLASFLHSAAASGDDRFYYDNGKEVDSFDGSLNLPTDPLLSVGGYDNRSADIGGKEFTGDIAEFIVFDKALGDAERNQVESYLAIKYGSTLDQATPTNYTASKGTVVWNATANSSYKNDIAGIGQDDDTSLNQTQSRSINTDSIVTIGNASNLENGEFLVWGNDDGSTTEVNTNIPTNVENRLGRVWQTQETGDVGTVDVFFDLSGLSVTGTQTSDFRLLVDADGDFATGATVVAANSFANSSSTVTFTGVDFSDGNYYTLATNTNDAPTVEAGIGNQTTAEDATFTFTIPQNAFDDVDGDTLTYTATLADGSNLPAWLTFSNGTFSGTPADGDVGTIEVKVTASDKNESVQTNFDLEVTNTNDAPTVEAGIGNQTTAEDATFTFTIPQNAFADVDGDTLTYTATLADGSELPTWLTFSDGTFSGTPADGDIGTIEVKVTASDASESVESNFDLEVKNTNDAPTVDAGIVNQTATEDDAFEFTIPQNAFADVDGDTLTYTATLADGSDLPAWLTFSNGTFSGTPADGDIGTIEVKVTASDASESVETNFNLEVTNTDNSTVVKVNGTEIDNSEIESYGGSQDNLNQGTVAILPDNQINLTGNRWQKVEINSTITANTVLRFEFASNGEGEIQGLGFDNNNVIRTSDARRLFQVGGSQNWGIQNLGSFIVGQVDNKDIYEIQVGQFFTGDFRYLTIANDHDVENSTSQAEFSNIEIFKTTPGQGNLLDISIDRVTQTKGIESYGGDSQNPNLTSAIANNSTQLNLEGNGWRKLNLDGYRVTANTTLRFDFNSNAEGEVIGIGFDNNDNISSREDKGRFFQVDGSQDWGIQNLDEFIVNEADSTQTYEIKVGDFFRGEFDYLTFGNDHDVDNPTSIAQFGNIELFEAESNEPSLNIVVDGVTESKEVESYGGDSQDFANSTVNGSQLEISGNGWKSLDITGYQIDENTQLSFEFKSNGEGEIQGIGFDNNNNISSRDDAQHFFQLTGSQSWGIEDSQYVNSLGTSEGGFTSYQINVGQLFTGDFDYLTFGNDHDVSNPTAVGEFRNISLG